MTARHQRSADAMPPIQVAWVAHKEAPVSKVVTLTWPVLVELVTTHKVGVKEGPGWLPARMTPGPRNGDRVPGVTALVLDVEAHTEKHPDGTKKVIGPLAPELPSVAAELELRGLAAALATSHSHMEPTVDGGTLGPRYRIVLPVAREPQPEDVKPLGLHVARLLGLSDCLDTGCLEPARLYYLPRCPADRERLADRAVVDGQPLDVDAMLKAAKAATSPPPGRTKGTQGASVIDAFNAAHDIDAILRQHGYEPRGNRWLWPGSSTGIPGVVRLKDSNPERIYSHHPNDPLAGDHSHDAFSAWCVLAHGGDVRAAVRAAAELLGMNRTKAEPGAGGAAPNEAARGPAGSSTIDDDDHDHHRNAPRPDPACLYGLVGEIAAAGSETTEANRFAIALNTLVWLGCCLGRGPYLALGNTSHHPRLFGMHVGRSGRGRKGDAISLIHRLDIALMKRYPVLSPQCHRGGLSSREGLAFLIHDGFKEGKNQVEPIQDKRLWVIESEFANVLHQTKRDGNTLSAALRDCWDGVSIKPATKSNRISATDPHVCLSAAVTPTELVSLIQQRELSNGFANRFLTIYADRERLIPIPVATPQDEVDRLAERAADVLLFVDADRWVEKDVLRMSLSADGRDHYSRLYRAELNRHDFGPLITGLLERRAPVLLRLAMIFALTDRLTVIEPRHIDAGLAWVRYWADSVRFIFRSGAEELAQREVTDAADKLVRFLADGRKSRKQINVDCFRGKLSKNRIDAAIDELLQTTPPRIVREEEPRRDGPGSPTTFYSLAANSANSADREQRRGSAGGVGAGEPSEPSEPSPDSADVDATTVRSVRSVRESSNAPETRTSTDDSLSSLSSPATDDTAVF